MDKSPTSTASTLVEKKNSADAEHIHITKAQAYSYRVPKSQAGRARPLNYIVVLKAITPDGREIEGIGEGQPRGWRTGEDAGDSWKFLAEAVAGLYEERIDVAEPAQSIDAVRAYMQKFSELAHTFALEAAHPRPFRGTLLGMEVALLDLVATARSQTLAQLLGQRRDAAPMAPPAVSVSTEFETLHGKLKAQAEAYGYTRVTGNQDVHSNVDFLEMANVINCSHEVGQPDKPLWIDFNGGLTYSQASEFLEEVAASVTAGSLTSRIFVEQPLPVSEKQHLGLLQKQVDEVIRSSGKPSLSINIVGDESIFDVSSLKRLRREGPVRAVNIRPAQAGGLLASLQLADEVLKAEPNSSIFLTRMVGASRITAAALRHLALALPQVDAAMVTSTVERGMRMSRRIKTEGERAERVHQGRSNAAPVSGVDKEKAAESVSTNTPSLRVIQSDRDEEPESDYGDEVESEDSTNGSGREGSPDVDDGENSESTEDDAEQHIAADPIRRFRVRDVPGIGMQLRFSGLVSDVRDAVTYPVAEEATFNGLPVTKYDDVDDLHPLGPNGSKGHLLEREALALGLNTTRYSKGAFTATDGKSEAVPFKWSRNPLSSAASLALCTHKEATRMQLQQAGVPVPQGRTFARGDFDTAKEFVNRIGYPVVVKPTMGVRGIGVVAGIEDEDQFDAALELMSGSKLGDQDFIVEKHVHGADYRIVVIGDEVIAAIQREPASVLGDGESTVAELLISKNISRKRNPHLWARPAKFDDAARHELEKSGRDLETVLPKGERQLLANTCSLSQGGDSIDVLDEMHPSIKEASVAAVKAMPGLHFCGVDFLLEDHTKPLDQQDAGICELNAHAAIGNCEYPMFGKGRPVARTLMRDAIEFYGLTARSERAERISLHLIVRGRVTAVDFRRWLQRRAHISGVSGWVRNVNRRTVEAVLVGPTDPTTAVAAATVLGPKRAVPTAYEAQHIPFPESLNGFEIREDAPKGTVVETIDAT